jgi:hypothetical protein
MLIDQVFFYFLIGIGVILSLPALWLLLRARWPQRVEKLQSVSTRSVLLSFIVGLLPLALMIGFFAAAAQLGKKGDVGAVISFALLGAVLLVWALAGLAGLVGLIGERLTSDKGNVEPWKATLRGGIVMVCLLSMPFLGWFALLPVCIITGGGMMVRSFFVKAQQPAQATVPQSAPPLPAQAATPMA